MSDKADERSGESRRGMLGRLGLFCLGLLGLVSLPACPGGGKWQSERITGEAGEGLLEEKPTQLLFNPKKLNRYEVMEADLLGRKAYLYSVEARFRNQRHGTQLRGRLSGPNRQKAIWST